MRKNKKQVTRKETEEKEIEERARRNMELEHAEEEIKATTVDAIKMMLR